MSAETQERRDARATDYLVHRRPPLNIGSTIGPRAMTNAHPPRRDASTFSADRVGEVTNLSNRNSSQSSFAKINLPSRRIIDPVDNYGVVYTDDNSTLFRDYTTNTNPEPEREMIDRMVDPRGLRRAEVRSMNVRVAELQGTNAAHGYDVPTFSHQSEISLSTHGMRPRMSIMKLTSSDRRGFSAFDGSVLPDTNASSLDTVRARTARQMESRSNATGIMSSRGSVFS